MRVIALCAAVLLFLAGPAAAGNRQAGDNSGTSSQDGSAASGDAIAGPSAGFHSSGDIRVRMTNRIGGSGPVEPAEAGEGTAGVTNVQGPTSVASGGASGSQESALFVGLGLEAGTSDVIADVFGAALVSWNPGVSEWT